MSQIEFDLGSGRSSRDTGMERVAGNNAEWQRVAILAIHALPSGWTGLPEDIWPAIRRQYGNPTHPNIYGVIINDAQKRGLLVKTGRRRPMSKASSHARMTDEYRRV